MSIIIQTLLPAICEMNKFKTNTLKAAGPHKWFYQTEILIQMLFGFVTFFTSEKYFYWCITFLSNGFMNFGRQYVTHSVKPTPFKLSSWPFIINEIGSYWIASSFILPILVDFNFISVHTLLTINVMIIPVTLSIIFMIPYNKMNLYHSIFGIPALIFSRMLSISWFLQCSFEVTQGEIICFLISNICSFVAAYEKFGIRRNSLFRANNSGIIWNASNALMSFSQGFIVFYR